jgi:hypothetical protein
MGMKTSSEPAAKDFGKTESRHQTENLEPSAKPSKSSISRRSFLGKSLAVGAGTFGEGLLANTPTA